MTGEKMCQEVLNAYINRNSKISASVNLTICVNGAFEISVLEYGIESMCSINIYNSYSDEKKQEKFKKMIALLKGEISLFDEKSNEDEED